MNADLIIYNAEQLVTCAANGKAKKGAAMRDVGIIENSAVAVKDGLIVAVGATKEILEKFSAEKMIDAEQKVVCPAFVDCHTHVVFAGNRLDEFELKIKGADYLEILAAGGGILSTVKKTREANLRELIEQSRKRLDKMLENGTCTAEIKTGYGLDSETELKMLQAIEELDKIHAIDLIPTFLPAHAVPPEYKGKADDYVELICQEMIPKAADWYKNSHFPPKQTHPSPLTTHHFFIDVFCEKNAFDLEQSRTVLQTGKNFSMGVKAHVDEFTNLGAARMAIEMGATSIDHLDATSDEEIALLAKSETVGIVTPTVNFNFGATNFANARKLIDMNCAVAVSTDYNPGSAPCPSLPLAMAIACRYQKLLPSESFNGITINAARALNLENKVGSLEPGKQADLLILDTDDYRQLAYEFGTNFIAMVIKKGEIVFS